MRKKNLIIYVTVFVLFLTVCIMSIIFPLKMADISTDIKINNETLKKTEEELDFANNQVIKYQDLLKNINKILFKTIYYGKAEGSNGEPPHFFTGFNIFYKEKFYLITAGHSVE